MSVDEIENSGETLGIRLLVMFLHGVPAAATMPKVEAEDLTQIADFSRAEIASQQPNRIARPVQSFKSTARTLWTEMMPRRSRMAMASESKSPRPRSRKRMACRS